MDNLQRATVSVSIDEDDLVPSEVTKLLGAELHLGVSKGEVFLGSNGREIVARTGKWQFRGGWENPPHLDKQIRDTLLALTTDMSAWADVTGRYHCYVSIGAYLEDWTGGITLQPSTLRLLAERNLPIDFDLYAPAASTPPAD